MKYNKIKNLFLKGLLVIVVSLFTFPGYLCADVGNLADLINNVSTVENSFCTEDDCFFPEKNPTEDDIYIENQINWDKGKNLVLRTKKNINL